MTESKALHIHGLQVENYKRIKHIAVTFGEAGSFAVMGGNEQGKSSMFDALEAALAGRKAPKQAMPVRKGAEKATIIADFGDVVVKRVYQPDGKTTLKVTNGDGFSDPTPEDTMRRLYSHVALDPLEFANLPAKDQADTLLRLIGFDPAPADAKRQTAFDNRTDANRKVKDLAAQLAAFPPVDAELPAEPVSASEILEQIATIQVENREREDAERRLEQATRRLEVAEAELDAARLEAVDAQKAIDSRTVSAQDVGPLMDRLNTVEETNERIRRQVARAEVATSLAQWETKAAQLTEAIAAAEQEKRDGLASHPMPVPGLDVIDGEVHLDGTPFSQSSTGAKIRTSVAIAMALNPTLRTILVRDANTLDKGNREIIHELAKANDFTVLLELVNTDEDRGIVIVDGEVAEVRS